MTEEEMIGTTVKRSNDVHFWLNRVCRCVPNISLKGEYAEPQLVIENLNQENADLSREHSPHVDRWRWEQSHVGTCFEFVASPAKNRQGSAEERSAGQDT